METKRITPIIKRKENILKHTSVDPKIRSYVESLLNMYIPNSKEVENALNDKYSTNPEKYVKNFTNIITFLDPKDYVGKYSMLFKNKVKYNMYSPERFTELTLNDIAPEIFLSDEIGEIEKKEVLNYLEDQFHTYVKNFNELLSGGHMKSKPEPIRSYKLDALKKIIDIKKKCYNNHWESVDSTTIICKENGRFYCLDAIKLWEEIQKTGTAFNPYTKKELSSDIINNIKKQHHTFNTTRTIDDIRRLNQAHQELEKVLNKLTIPKVKADGLNTLSNLPDDVPKEISIKFEEEYKKNPDKATTNFLKRLRNAKKSALRIIKGLEEITGNQQDTMTDEERVAYLLKYLDDYDQEVEAEELRKKEEVMEFERGDYVSEGEGDEREDYAEMPNKYFETDHEEEDSDSDEYDDEQSEENDDEDDSDSDEDSSESDSDEEEDNAGNSNETETEFVDDSKEVEIKIVEIEKPEQVIVGTVELLSPNSISRYIYDIYMAKLETLKEILNEKIKKGETSELKTMLETVETEIEKLKEQVKSKDSVIQMIKQYLKILEKKIQEKEKEGIHLLLNETPDNEYTELKKLKENSKSEIIYLEGI